jgi:hypothetical protein
MHLHAHLWLVSGRAPAPAPYRNDFQNRHGLCVPNFYVNFTYSRWAAKKNSSPKKLIKTIRDLTAKASFSGY